MLGIEYIGNTTAHAGREVLSSFSKNNYASASHIFAGMVSYTLDNRRDSNVLEEEEGEMFGYIPPEINATRLPGSGERTPILLRLGVVLLVILNLALAVGAMWGIMT